MTAMAANAVANNRKAAARRLLEARRIVALEGRGGKGARSERKRALEVRSAGNTREESLCAVEPIPDEEEKRGVRACARPPSH